MSPKEALDEAQSFLSGLGYTVTQRDDNSLTAQRGAPDQAGYTPYLTVEADPQPEGGVRIAVRGNDQEGVQANQNAWAEWSEGLPKKPAVQPGAQTHDVNLPPPPTVESADLPPAPQPPPSFAPTPSAQRSGLGTGVKLAIGGCIVLVLLGLLTIGGCFALVATMEPASETDSSDVDPAKEQQKKGRDRESTVSIGQPVTVGDVTWRVTDARLTNQLTQQGVSKQFAKTEQGNFVIVDFDFTNNGSDAITLDNESLALIDSEGRESKPSSDDLFYVPDDRRVFLERINPGVTRQGQAIFEVAPGASGFQLQAGDAQMFTDENGYVNLGF